MTTQDQDHSGLAHPAADPHRRCFAPCSAGQFCHCKGRVIENTLSPPTELPTEEMDCWRTMIEAGVAIGGEWIAVRVAHANDLYTAMLSAAPSMKGDEVRGWQPIETAPKDGTFVLTWDAESEHGIVRFFKPYELGGGDPWCGATHWMPLPEPPSQALASSSAR